MATHSSILPENVHGQRSLVGYSPRGRKELGTTETEHAHTSSNLIVSSFRSILKNFFSNLPGSTYTTEIIYDCL